jgi:hypothetical protein
VQINPQAFLDLSSLLPQSVEYDIYRHIEVVPEFGQVDT